MARALYPATHLTPAQIQLLAESAERAVLVECSRRTNKKVFLKAGPGPDTAQIGGQLVGNRLESELVARAGLPDTDYNAGAVTYDQWLTAALTASVEYNFISQQLRTDQVAAVYGVATLDANPGISRVRALVGTAIVLAAWDTTPLWAAQDTMGYADEYSLFGVQETMNIWLMPFLTKAAGERFIVLSYIAEPKGTGPITK